jgi:hypothetical protein
MAMSSATLGSTYRQSRDEVAVRLDLLTPGIEVGLVTTNLDAMVS